MTLYNFRVKTLRSFLSLRVTDRYIYIHFLPISILSNCCLLLTIFLCLCNIYCLKYFIIAVIIKMNLLEYQRKRLHRNEGVSSTCAYTLTPQHFICESKPDLSCFSFAECFEIPQDSPERMAYPKGKF